MADATYDDPIFDELVGVDDRCCPVCLENIARIDYDKHIHDAHGLTVMMRIRLPLKSENENNPNC